MARLKGSQGRPGIDDLAIGSLRMGIEGLAIEGLTIETMLTRCARRSAVAAAPRAA
jgi:hypothetical protein